MKKPILTSEQLVLHMRDKGISFSIISEEDAIRHLSEHNNYFKLTSYRKNYTKYSSGPNKGKYENLEFAYLRELARIDTEIRHLLLDMSLDIEHFLKVSLMQAVEAQIENGEDGYRIITDYLFDNTNGCTSQRAENAAKRTNGFARTVTLSRKNPYCSGLIKKYAEEMPVWAFIELISFSELKNLVEYYSGITGWNPPIDMLSLDRVRQIRNACAHGNAIINDLKAVDSENDASVAPEFITQFVVKAGISKVTRKKKLSNPRINQIVHLLYIYDQIVTSKYTRQLRLSELKRLMSERIPQHADYFQSNPILVSTYDFFNKIVSIIK